MLAFTLFHITIAHMYISNPEPDFKHEFRYDKYAPSVKCNIVKFTTQDTRRTIEDFRSNFYFKNLRDYADECAKANSVNICASSSVDNIKPFPGDGNVRINMGVNHIGPSELWVDGTLVYQNSGLDHNTPEVIHVDFWNICKDVCKLRFIMVALHLNPNAEIFDNCVLVSGSQPGSNHVVITSSSVPTNTPDNWVCNSWVKS